MHPEQIEFCQHIANHYPQHFEHKIVLDVGSQDINGNNQYLFTNCEYWGLDIGEGENVDIICPVHLYSETRQKHEPKQFDTIVSTEMLEHDCFYKESIRAMYNLLKPGGFLLVTAASINRAEHGTKRTTPHASPHTPDYYKNITIQMVKEALKPYLIENPNMVFNIEVFNQAKDIGFYLIKP